MDDSPPAPTQVPAQDPTFAQRPTLLLLGGVVLGLAVRVVLWILAGDVELQSDEANYLHLAVQWHELGFYPDSFRFLWPPGYPAYLLLCIRAFGPDALEAARLGQIAASASIGWFTGMIAWRLFGKRAAGLAVLLWALHLPMASFTHYLWNETLFLSLLLPAIYLVLRVVQSGPDEQPRGRILLAGLCLAGSLYIKEAATYLLPAWALLLALGLRGGPSLEGLRRGSLLLLTVMACVLPWGLRNLQVYGKVIPLGSSLGENAYNGLGAAYRNFDLVPLEGERARRGLPAFTLRPWLTSPPEGATPWKRAEEIPSLPARLSENTSRGLAFASEHPGWFLRSRLQKVCDAVVPTSFFTRHLALGHYQGSLGSSPWRPFTAWTSGLQVVLVLLLGGVGLLGSLPAGPARRLIWLTLAYFLATTLLVSMSRFRLPVMPLFFAGVGGLLAFRPQGLGRLRAGLWVLGLALAWWVNAPILSQVWPMVLGTEVAP